MTTMAELWNERSAQFHIFPNFPKLTDRFIWGLSHTVHGDVPLCPGDKVSVQLLQILSLGNWTTEVVDKDGSRAVGL